MNPLSQPVVSSHPSRVSARKRANTADETSAETTGPGRPDPTGQKKKACSGPPKSPNRPYDNRPRSGPGREARRTSPDTNAVRVVLPDEPPRLTPGAATALLRILLKAAEGAAE
jgi:hypothetical protein